MMHVVEVRDRFAQRLDPSRRAVFSAVHRDVDRVRTLKGAFDVVVHFGGPLPEIGPRPRVFEEAMLLMMGVSLDLRVLGMGEIWVGLTYARSVVQTTPVDALVGSSPACARCPSWAARNCLRRLLVLVLLLYIYDIYIPVDFRIEFTAKLLGTTYIQKIISRSHLEAVGWPVVENRRPLTSLLTDTLRSEKLMLADVPRNAAGELGFKC